MTVDAPHTVRHRPSSGPSRGGPSWRSLSSGLGRNQPGDPDMKVLVYLYRWCGCGLGSQGGPAFWGETPHCRYRPWQHHWQHHRWSEVVGCRKKRPTWRAEVAHKRIKLLPKDQRIKKIEESLCSWTINLRRLDVHPQFWCRFSTQLNQPRFYRFADSLQGRMCVCCAVGRCWPSWISFVLHSMICT